MFVMGRMIDENLWKQKFSQYWRLRHAKHMRQIQQIYIQHTFRDRKGTTCNCYGTDELYSGTESF